MPFCKCFLLQEEWKGNMADVVSSGESQKKIGKKLDCFNKLCFFKAVTYARYLYSIGWNGKAIDSFVG